MPIFNHLERRVTQLFSILSFIKRQALYPDFKKMAKSDQELIRLDFTFACFGTLCCQYSYCEPHMINRLLCPSRIPNLS